MLLTTINRRIRFTFSISNINSSVSEYNSLSNIYLPPIGSCIIVICRNSISSQITINYFISWLTSYIKVAHKGIFSQSKIGSCKVAELYKNTALSNIKKILSDIKECTKIWLYKLNCGELIFVESQSVTFIFNYKNSKNYNVFSW